MSQIGFESAAAAFGIDLDALKTMTAGASAVPTGKAAITPQADIADSEEVGSPTTAEFNALLQVLRDAGVLITA